MGEDGAMVFDAIAVALGGVVRARFRFTVFRGDDAMVMARAQERITTLPFLAPAKETLEREHRHTFRDLNASFLAATLYCVSRTLGTSGSWPTRSSRTRSREGFNSCRCMSLNL